MSAAHHCRHDCGARVILVRNYPPLDWVPDPQGIAGAYQDALGAWHARTVAPGEVLRPPWKRYALHSATCTAVPEPLPVTDLGEYRKAKAT